MKKLISAAAVALGMAALAPAPEAEACSRVLYQGNDSLYIVARSLDWKTPIPTNLYVYPRGMEKKGSAKPGAVTWTSKYGAVYAVSYDAGITEGMNEKGLVVNGLFCKGTVFSSPATKGRAPISLSMFVGWLLDTCETTDEVAALLKAHNFDLSGSDFDNGTTTALHWGVTDATGHSIIFEFDNGNINVYEMGDYLAMTNDPNWPAMTAIIDYWNKIGGKNMLPGTVTSPDRAVRANYFAHHVEKTADTDLGVAIARSILVNSSVPYTYLIEGEPNLSSTQWRSYADTRDKRYYFDLVVNPGIYYVDLNEFDLRPGKSVYKLVTSKTNDLVGNAHKRFEKSAPFTPAL